MSIHKRKMATGLVTAFVAAALIAPLLTIGASGAATNHARQVAPRVSVTSLPRDETLYTSGISYGAPTTWNPMAFDAGGFATGTSGLLYETLFLYNPVTNSYMPWLARSGTWTTPSTYTIVLRNGLTWSNGTALTCADVAYTIMLAKTNSAVPYAGTIGPNLSGVSCTNTTTAVVTFSSPEYTQWQSFLWNSPIVNKSVWSKLTPTEQVTGANAHPIGSGPMLLYAANDQEVVYTDNPNWWATKDLGLKFHFKYLVDLVNIPNPVALGLLLSGGIDWCNNFVAGIGSLVSSPASTGVLNGTGGDGLLTYYPTAPYMLSANTVWLEPNTTKFPMSNLNFRKALAYAIDPSQLASVIYDNGVDPANPTGLLPNLDPYIPASMKQYEFGYNPAKAKAFLAKSGYKGTPVTIQDPDGWTDWNSATDLIVQELKAVGINAVAYFPQDPARNANLTSGTYDLALDNNATVDATPWSYFNRVFALPILKQQSAQLNWERFSDPAAWALVQKIGSIVPTDTAAIQAVYTQLETIFLQNLPEIPLWYNGAWAQFSTKYWHDYPTSTSPNDQYTPQMWHGWVGAMTTVLALAQLEPTGTK
jgi:peptide/nickel transport system substrate-binding protein